MAAKIKLQRKGTKNKPFYRVIEILGLYDPLKEPSLFEVDKEKTQHWLKKGAEPTEKVRILLGKAGIMEAVDLASLPKKRSKAEIKAAAAAKAEGNPAEGEAKPAEGEAKAEAKEEPKKEEEKEQEKAEAKPEESK